MSIQGATMTDLQVSIRPYQTTDWPILCLIHDAARLEELKASGLSDAFLTLEQTAHSEGLFDGEVWVACLPTGPVGFAAFFEDELTWLYVAPDRARQGIGRALLQHRLRMHPSALRTECLVGNEAALRLYLSLGFVVIKQLEGRLTGNERFAASGLVLERPADVSE
jgi:ribosomal protein S18 acetylase RimI-like enzyme